MFPLGELSHANPYHRCHGYPIHRIQCHIPLIGYYKSPSKSAHCPCVSGENWIRLLFPPLSEPYEVDQHEGKQSLTSSALELTLYTKFFFNHYIHSTFRNINVGFLPLPVSMANLHPDGEKTVPELAAAP